jgi:predicted restriction endonuclease
MCSRCKRLVPANEARNGRCLPCETEHQRERNAARPSWSPNRNRSAQARFRREVLKAAGYRCQAMLANGYRCTVTEPLYAHHQVKGSYNAVDGVALCRSHHRQVDRHAR